MKHHQRAGAGRRARASRAEMHLPLRDADEIAINFGRTDAVNAVHARTSRPHSARILPEWVQLSTGVYC